MIYVKCNTCGDMIPLNTDGELIFCDCEDIGVDGNEFYFRVLGHEGSYSFVEETDSIEKGVE